MCCPYHKNLKKTGLQTYTQNFQRNLKKRKTFVSFFTFFLFLYIFSFLYVFVYGRRCDGGSVMPVCIKKKASSGLGFSFDDAFRTLICLVLTFNLYVLNLFFCLVERMSAQLVATAIDDAFGWIANCTYFVIAFNCIVYTEITVC